MKTLRITLFALGFAALFSGCGGAEGPAGPQGPQGYSGVTGYSSTFTSNPGDWQSSSSGGLNFLIAGYNVGIIDANAVSNGVVAVYFESTAGNWAPLPDTYPVGSVEQTFTYNYVTGILTLQMQNSDNSVPTAPPAFNAKVVVIPTAILKQHPGFNIKDYSMVKQLMNLPN